MKRLIPLRLALGAAGLLAICLIVAACGSSSSSSSPSASTEGSSSGSDTAPEAAALVYVINDYTSVELEGIEKVVKTKGGKVTTLSSNFNPQEQLAQCQDAITSQRYNVLFVDPVDSPSAIPCAVQAAEQGIKVIAFENPIGQSRTEVEPQISQVQGSVVINPLEDAEHTFELVEQACEGVSKCKWIVEIGTKTSPLDSTKLKRMEELVETADNIEIVEVLEGNYDPSETAKKAPDALSAHPDANVFTFESDTNALAAIPAVEEAGLQKQVMIIGDGGSRAGANAIKSGKMFASVSAWPLSTGEIAGQMAIEALGGEVKTPGVSVIPIKEPINLTKETIGEYTSQWGSE